MITTMMKMRDNIFTRINSKYYDLPDINNLSNESSLGILHTNLASLYKYHDDLEQILPLMKKWIFK